METWSLSIGERKVKCYSEGALNLIIIMWGNFKIDKLRLSSAQLREDLANAL